MKLEHWQITNHQLISNEDCDFSIISLNIDWWMGLINNEASAHGGTFVFILFSTVNLSEKLVSPIGFMKPSFHQVDK